LIAHGGISPDTAIQVLLGKPHEHLFLGEYADFPTAGYEQQAIWLRDPSEIYGAQAKLLRTPGAGHRADFTPGVAASTYTEDIVEGASLVPGALTDRRWPQGRLYTWSHRLRSWVSKSIATPFVRGGTRWPANVAYLVGPGSEEMWGLIGGEAGAVAVSPETLAVGGQGSLYSRKVIPGSRGTTGKGLLSLRLQYFIDDKFLAESGDVGQKTYKVGRPVGEILGLSPRSSREMGRAFPDPRFLDRRPHLTLGQVITPAGRARYIRAKHVRDVLEEITTTETGYKLKIRHHRPSFKLGTMAVVSGERVSLTVGPMGGVTGMETPIDIVLRSGKWDDPRIIRTRIIEHYVAKALGYARTLKDPRAREAEFASILAEELGAGVRQAPSFTPYLTSARSELLPTEKTLHDVGYLHSGVLRNKLEHRFGMEFGQLKLEELQVSSKEGRAYLQKLMRATGLGGKKDKRAISRLNQLIESNPLAKLIAYEGQQLSIRSASGAAEPMRKASEYAHMRIDVARKLALAYERSGSPRASMVAEGIRKSIKQKVNRSNLVLKLLSAPLAGDEHMERLVSRLESIDPSLIKRVKASDLPDERLHNMLEKALEERRDLTYDEMSRLLKQFGLEEGEYKKNLGFLIEFDRDIPYSNLRQYGQVRKGAMTRRLILFNPFEVSRLVREDSPTGLITEGTSPGRMYQEYKYINRELRQIATVEKGSVNPLANTLVAMRRLVDPASRRDPSPQALKEMAEAHGVSPDEMLDIIDRLGGSSRHDQVVERLNAAAIGLTEAQVGQRGLQRRGVIGRYRGGSFDVLNLAGEGLQAQVTEAGIRRKYTRIVDKSTRQTQADLILEQLGKYGEAFGEAYRHPVHGTTHIVPVRVTLRPAISKSSVGIISKALKIYEDSAIWVTGAVKLLTHTDHDGDHIGLHFVYEKGPGKPAFAEYQAATKDRWSAINPRAMALEGISRDFRRYDERILTGLIRREQRRLHFKSSKGLSIKEQIAGESGLFLQSLGLSPDKVEDLIKTRGSLRSGEIISRAVQANVQFKSLGAVYNWSTDQMRTLYALSGLRNDFTLDSEPFPQSKLDQIIRTVGGKDLFRPSDEDEYIRAIYGFLKKKVEGVEAQNVLVSLRASISQAAEHKRLGLKAQMERSLEDVAKKVSILEPAVFGGFADPGNEAFQAMQRLKLSGKAAMEGVQEYHREVARRMVGVSLADQILRSQGAAHVEDISTRTEGRSTVRHIERLLGSELAEQPQAMTSIERMPELGKAFKTGEGISRTTVADTAQAAAKGLPESLKAGKETLFQIEKTIAKAYEKPWGKLVFWGVGALAAYKGLEYAFSEEEPESTMMPTPVSTGMGPSMPPVPVIGSPTDGMMAGDLANFPKAARIDRVLGQRRHFTGEGHASPLVMPQIEPMSPGGHVTREFGGGPRSLNRVARTPSEALAAAEYNREF